MKRLVAQWTLVRSWQVGAVFVLILHVDTHRRHSHRGACHGRCRRRRSAGATAVAVGRRKGCRCRRLRGGSRRPRVRLLLNLRVLRVQQRAKHVKRIAASLGWRKMLNSSAGMMMQCDAMLISAEVTFGEAGVLLFRRMNLFEQNA